jgi:hypothetical protein
MPYLFLHDSHGVVQVLQLEGYTLEEKLGIAEQHLVPRQIARHGLRPQQLTVTKEALQARLCVHAPCTLVLRHGDSCVDEHRLLFVFTHVKLG